MAICEDCKKDVLEYQAVMTKRNTRLVFCNECIKKYRRKEADSARDSKKPI